MEKETIRVLLVDGQALIRHGIHRLLEDAPGLEVVAEAGDGEQALTLARQESPDVVLMDAALRGVGGLEVARRLRAVLPSIGVVVLTEADDPLLAHLLEAGVTGCLTKDCGLDDIVAAIEAVARGERYISTDIARQMALSILPGGESPFEQLSQRELQVMLMVARGQSVHTISETLCLSPKTVSTYRYRLFDKLGVDNDVGLAHLAIRHGLVDRLVPA